MDNTTRKLAEYITRLDYSALSAQAVHETKKRLVDAIACAIGGYASEPADIARKVSANVSGTPAARIFNTGKTTSIDMAAFTNATMVRYLDFNDTYISIGSGHPSDMIPAMLAVADAHHLGGKELLLGIATGYEVFTAMADQIGLRDKGWDQGFFLGMSVAAGVAKMLKLNLEQTANAIAITVTANVPTRQSRAGELAMWKGVATAAAARSAVQAVLLAQAGMTGPTAAFEGKDGIWDKVTGKFTLNELGGNGKPFGIERTNLKFFPSEYHSQAPMWIALELRKKVAVTDIEAVNVLHRVERNWQRAGEMASENPRDRGSQFAVFVVTGLHRRRCQAEQFYARAHCRSGAARVDGAYQDQRKQGFHGGIPGSPDDPHRGGDEGRAAHDRGRGIPEGAPQESNDRRGRQQQVRHGVRRRDAGGTAR
jgi:2-methylcitrate dehydratase